MMAESDLRLDALYTIFEKHMYDFEDNEESEDAFIAKIVQDYMSFLTAQGVVIPRRWTQHVILELHDQVRKMLVKKMYGCLSIKEFMQGQSDRKERRKNARKKYSKLF